MERKREIRLNKMNGERISKGAQEQRIKEVGIREDQWRKQKINKDGTRMSKCEDYKGKKKHKREIRQNTGTPEWENKMRNISEKVDEKTPRGKRRKWNYERKIMEENDV